ncbi:TetR/AcrR family transcriptional regulator [Bacillus swezeyi]|uniref:TetR/AcrR family transcriptional regulator n=1 Tax=Bacillus swezeyi TaxID=1925020 RepID=A0A5M8RJS6_9BACI|nr:TetR/AcrR family transcriptional regulator C-terminal domain-containing protein [Bacillus swezeyi]KAA6447660.1 TetR/AcrR family transcriptional regulator [Bacillus swezeyi]KAA6473964.1 TetR/AcrR family transcriptional regulator [Bacillus swezeyi]TYS34242.1 TetR/AcrR family transcriptional regulator [Bacillus swezeyi]
MSDSYRGDKRMTQSKKNLKKALFELLAEKEWKKISVQDITDRANLNRTTFYQHYQDKYDLLHQHVRGMFAAMKEAIFSPLELDGDTENPEAYWYVLRFYKHLKNNFHDFTIIINRRSELDIKGLLNDFWNDSFLTGIKKAADNEVQNTVPLDIQRQFLIYAYAGTASWWLENGMPYTPEYMAEAMISLIQKN